MLNLIFLEVFCEDLVKNGLHVHSFMLILSFVSHWVHNVEGNILASLEEEPPEMPLTGARMEQANLLESRMRHVGFLTIRNNL